MIFWLLSAGLALLTVLALIWPILRRPEAALDRADSAIAIFRDQLAEVDRDAERGLISDEEASAARTEIQRRMLAADKARGTGGAADGSGRGLLLVCAVITPIAAAGIYTLLGAPGTPSLPFAERQAEQQDAQNLNELTARLRARLESEPEGGESRGWQLLATTYMNMGRYGDAVYAYSNIVEREEATSATWSQYAEAIISSERGVVTKPAEDAIAKSLELDPLNPAGTYYRAIGVDQAGQTLDARRMLLERIAAEPAEQPWMETFLREANRMGAEFGLDPVGLPEFPDAPRGPSAADVEAASEMSEEERMEFIQNMVSNLASRLQEEPGNLQGWLQLARAYMVLGQRDDARGALESAKILTDTLPGDDPRRVAVEEGLAELSAE